MPKKKYSARQAQADLPTRYKNDNKTRGGKCLIIAGSKGMWGAAVLCAQAAARVGAGYTYIYDFKNSFPSLRFPDFLITSNKKDFSKFSALAVGPGVQDRALLKKYILTLMQINHPSVVLDAEALNVLALEKKVLHIPSSWIMTPHEGEMGRLLQLSSQQVQSQREQSAIELQKKWGCRVLLKGSPTLVADGKTLFQIQSGNSSLAKAGTGDVLTGMITGLLSQGVTSSKAACLGAYIHGRISDQWIDDGNDQLSLLATDLLQQLPVMIAKIR
jgi:ADP-dependent NAD(P)H-hydrate dehydratase